MNYDRNGVLATTSRPKPVLRKCYRVVTVDSRDRDPTKFVKVNGGATVSDPGDYVVYLPRPFQKVTRIRLMNAALLGVQPSDTYIMMQLEGLNRMDECASGADRSGYVDSTFAKILNDRPVVATGATYTYSQITGITNRQFTTPTVAVGSAGAATVVAVSGTTVTYGGFTLAANLGFNNSMVGQFITVTGFANTANNGTFQVTSNTTTQIVVTGNAGATVVSASGTIVASATINIPLTVSGISSSVVTFTTAQQVANSVVTIYGFTGAYASLNGTWTSANTAATSFTISTPAGTPLGPLPNTAPTGYVANLGGNIPVTATVVVATSTSQGYATQPSANALLTNITFAGSGLTYTVGQNVNVSGYTGLWAALNGNYVVLYASGSNFTVASSAPIPISAVTGSGTTQPTCLMSAVGNGSTITYTFNGAHNINVGQTITVALSGQSGGPFMTGVVTSVPSSTTLTMASTYNGTIFLGPNTTVTVNNLQYSYITTITTSFVTGQYLVISGFTSPNAAANAAAQILQSSLSTGTSGTFETTNVATLTAAQTAGTAIISQAIYYNDMSYAPNITYYNPPIGTLDRLHITLRRHLPLSSVTATNPTNAPITFGPAENTFAFEIEYIDNVFEDVSAFETRLDNADYTPKFQV